MRFLRAANSFLFMEKTITKRTLKDFRNRENPWVNRSYAERLSAVTEISQTNRYDTN